MAVATRSGVCCAPKISDPRSSRQVDRTHYLELTVASPCPVLSMRSIGSRKPLDHVVVGCGLRWPGNFGGLLHCGRFSTPACPVLCLLGFMPRMHLEDYEVAMVLHVVDAISKRLLQQVGVLNDGGFLQWNLSLRDAPCQWKVKERRPKPLALSDRMHMTAAGLTCIRPLLKACEWAFCRRFPIALSSRLHRPSSFISSLARRFCLVVNRDSLWRSCEGRSCVTRVVLV